MLTTILAPIIGVWSLWTHANSTFYTVKNLNEKMYDVCEWRYVGKQPLDLTAAAIPIIPPVGEPYILFKQFCKNEE